MRKVFTLHNKLKSKQHFNTIQNNSIKQMAYNRLRLPKAFKFSEEIITKVIIPTKQSDEQENFDVQFIESKKCTATDDNPLIPESTVCRNCYYEAFAHKMLAVRKSKRKNFVEFQMNLRNDKLTFLQELEELLIDCESYFNRSDYATQADYQNVLEELKIMTSSAQTIEHEIFDNSEHNSMTKVNLNNIAQKYALDIFISHSSSDKNVAAKLIKVLREALNIKSNRILCTSVDGYKLAGGVNTDEHLRFAIEENQVCVGIISENSLKSNYVLFELGARWGLKLPFKPVVTKREDLAFIKAPLRNMHVQNLSEVTEVIQLVTEISKILSIEIESASVYLDSIDELITEIKRSSSLTT